MSSELALSRAEYRACEDSLIEREQLQGDLVALLWLDASERPAGGSITEQHAAIMARVRELLDAVVVPLEQRAEKIESLSSALRAAKNRIVSLEGAASKLRSSNAALADALGEARTKLLFDVHDAREAVRAQIALSRLEGARIFQAWSGVLVFAVLSDECARAVDMVGEMGLRHVLNVKESARVEIEALRAKLKQAEIERDDAIALAGLRDTVPPPGEWQSLAVAHDGDSTRVYVSGVEYVRANKTAPIPSSYIDDDAEPVACCGMGAE